MIIRRLLLVLCICSMSAAVFAAAADEHTFQLKWQEDGFHQMANARFDRAELFASEPDFGQREIFRGEMCIGFDQETESLGYAWDVTEGKLYVDLNRDGDLTNDPDGIVETLNPDSGRYLNHSFPQFPLSITTERGEHRYQVSASCQNYPVHQSITFNIRSGYKGQVKLYEDQWRFRVVDRLRAAVQRGDNFSVSQVGNENDGNKISSLRLPNRLFLGGRCYDVSFEFKAGEDQTPQLWGKLKEKEVPLAKLRLEGKGISRLVFGDRDLLVLPKLSEEAVLVPAGDFKCQSLSLRGADNRDASPQRVSDITVSVSTDSENVLRIGAPLNHQVKIQRSGKVLKFDYELVGSGGETYNMRDITGYASDNKPSVTIYKGGMQVGSGEFEYG